MLTETEQWIGEIVGNPRYFITLNLPPNWKGSVVENNKVVANAIHIARCLSHNRRSINRHRVVGWFEVGTHRGCHHFHGIANNIDCIEKGWEKALIRRGYEHIESNVQEIRSLESVLVYIQKGGDNPNMFI